MEESEGRSHPDGYREMMATGNQLTEKTEDYQVIESASKLESKNKKVIIEDSCLLRLLQNPWFTHSMGCVILGNGIVIGLETDYPDVAHWSRLENIFLFIFIGELIARMGAEGKAFLNVFNDEIGWNVFDCIIVGLGVFDFVADQLGGLGSGGFATIFRLLRLTRVLRLVRLLQFLRSLYLLAVGLLEACKAVFWVTILMSFVLYVCAVTLVRTLGRLPASDKHYEFLQEYFGNIPSAMISLFISMTSPNLYSYQDEVGLLEERPGLLAFLIIFITLGSFGMIATLTGVITDRVFANNLMLQDEKRQDHENARRNLSTNMRLLFDSLQHDDQGHVTIEALKQIAPEILQMIEDSGGTIDHGDVISFIEHMDLEHSGLVSFKHFSTAMTTYAEGVSPMSMIKVLHRINRCVTQVRQVEERILAVDQRVLDVMEHQSETLQLVPKIYDMLCQSSERRGST